MCYFNVIVLVTILTQLKRKSKTNQQYRDIKYAPYVHLPSSHNIEVNLIACFTTSQCDDVQLVHTTSQCDDV
jgi:hypothetical protein